MLGAKSLPGGFTDWRASAEVLGSHHVTYTESVDFMTTKEDQACPSLRLTTLSVAVRVAKAILFCPVCL